MSNKEIPEDVLEEAIKQLEERRKERLKSMFLAPLSKLVINKKYVKTKSLTWWTGFLPLFAGVAMSVEDIVPGANVIVEITKSFTQLGKEELIWIGLGMIGVRGAFK